MTWWSGWKEKTQIGTFTCAEELEANEMNGMNCIARCSLKTPSGKVLCFEARIEDDGSCINLLTPYREAAFVDLENCVCDGWPG
jgi:hypothetical protein